MDIQFFLRFRHLVSTMCFLFLLNSVIPAQLSDSFSDGDFSSNPIWQGNTALFTVNAAQELQLNDVVAGQSLLHTSFTEESLDNKEWSIWVRQSFAGSDNNQSRIYFACSGAPGNYTGAGTAGVTGYFLKLGEAGSTDAIKLCRDDGSGNITELAAGSASLISSSFTVRIKVQRDETGNWTVLADPSGGTAYSTECTANDNTYSSATHFGLICLYTASNSDNFFFDDIFFGTPVTDTTPPDLTSATALSATLLELEFSEPLNIADSDDPTNYSAEGIGNPQSANTAGSSVTLEFAVSFPENTSLTITVTGIADNAGNVLISDSEDFMWSPPAAPSFRSVVFNEVLADPTPVVGLPEAEFVELHNPGPDAFNLEGWSFVNSSTAKVLPSYLLPPGGYVVLCEDDNAPLFTNSIGISSFTALTNTTDSLTLLDPENNVIDILVYSVEWFNDDVKADGGWSLEQINPSLSCTGSGNWSESNSLTGGTPAAENSVYSNTPDTSAPAIESVSVEGTSLITIHFTESMDSESIADASIELLPFFVLGNFEWSNDLTGLTFSCEPAVEYGIAYTLIVSGLTDCSGNTMNEFTGEVLVGESPIPGDVIIQEIMADPDPAIAGPPAEYIELYNKSSKLLDLRNCSLNEELFPDQVLLYPDSFIIIADASNAPAFFAFPNRYLLESFPGLTNSGSTLTLLNPENDLLDEVTYSDSWYGDADKADGGWSLELINPFDPCSDASNWTASVDPAGSTAGRENSVFDPTPDSNAPSFIVLLNEPAGAVTLLFDEPLDVASIDNLTWSINGDPQPSTNALITADDPTRLRLIYPTLATGVLHNILVSGISDCWGNSVNNLSVQFGIPEEAQPGDIVINEVLFNPPGTLSEDFVEIHNISSRVISIQNWSLANEEAGQPANTETISEQAFVILPGDYRVITEDGSWLPEYYPFTRSEKIITASALPSLNTDEGVVYLIMPDGTISDRMSYTEDMHFPLLDDVDGVSLERIDPLRDSEDPTNWLSAAESQGFATPGYVNSQAFTAGVSDEQISLDPEVFSPDNDGYQDVLTIGYQLNESGMTGSMTIYTSDGQRVRRLMRNELLGTTGQISWDGTGDEGEALAIGIYVIYAEFFTPDGRVSRVRKACVLAHQLGGN